MINIVTGYSGPGGSTIALRNLCKQFINRDIECVMYGPHDWFIENPKYNKLLSELSPSEDDKFITHFIGLKEKPKGTTLHFCHEMGWFDFNKIQPNYDKVVFLNERQRDFHCSSANIPNSTIIPNVKETILCVKSDLIKNTAGIIGAIEQRKNTKESIQRALADGCERVILFGVILDPVYFENEVKPLLSDKVIMAGFQSKTTIYSMVGKVYHSPKGEVASLVKDECYTTGTEFFGNEETANEVSTLTNDEVIELWRKEFEIQ
jgi:hypothetical protein